MGDMLQHFILATISNKYCENKETIEDVIKNYNEAIKDVNKGVGYVDKLGHVLTRIDMLSELFSMKKLKDHRDDALKLLDVLKQETDKLEKIIKEEK